jgi:hypothetical protein
VTNYYQSIYMEKTILTIKTDKKVKQEAQEATREKCLPNARLKTLLKDIKKESKKRNSNPFNYKESVEYLDK